MSCESFFFLMLGFGKHKFFYCVQHSSKLSFPAASSHGFCVCASWLCINVEKRFSTYLWLTLFFMVFLEFIEKELKEFPELLFFVAISSMGFKI